MTDQPPKEFRVGSHPPLKNPGVYGKRPFNGDPKDFAWSSGAMRKNFEAVDRMLASYGMKLVYLGGDEATGEFVAYGNNVLWHRHFPYDGAKIALNVLYINGKKRKLSTVMDMDPDERNALFGKKAKISEDPIEKFLADNNVTKWEVDSAGRYSFSDPITLNCNQLDKLPLVIKKASFIKIIGGNSLIGLPKTIKRLQLVNTKITTLEGCPSGTKLILIDLYSLQTFKGIGQFEQYEFWDLGKISPYEMRYLLIHNAQKIYFSNAQYQQSVFPILMDGRVNGVMPSELIPGKIKQLKDLA